MTTPPMPLVQVFAPDGTLGDIPYDQLHGAIAAGGKIATKMKAPDGTTGFVPADQRAEALKAGGTAIPFDLSDADGEKPGFWSHVKQSFQGMTQGPQSVGEAAKEGLTRSMGILPSLYQAGRESVAASQRGHGIPYSTAAGISTMAGVSPERMEQAAESGDTAGVLGEAAVPTALAVAPVAGELAGKTGIPSAFKNTVADYKPQIVSELDKTHSLTGRAVKYFADQALPGPTQAEIKASAVAEKEAAKATAQQEAAAAKQEASDRKAIPVSKNPTPGGYTGPASARAAAKTAEPQVVAPTAPATESEGRPATWTNDRVVELAKQGDPRAIQQGRLRQLILPQDVNLVSNKEARVTPSVGKPRSVTAFDAEGKPTDNTPEENFVYRVRPEGETGVPIRNPFAHATTSLEEAQNVIQPGLEGLEENAGKNMQMIKYDLSKLTEGKDYVRVPREGQPDWIKMLRPLRENEVQSVKPQ